MRVFCVISEGPAGLLLESCSLTRPPDGALFFSALGEDNPEPDLLAECEVDRDDAGRLVEIRTAGCTVRLVEREVQP